MAQWLVKHLVYVAAPGLRCCTSLAPISQLTCAHIGTPLLVVMPETVDGGLKRKTE